MKFIIDTTVVTYAVYLNIMITYVHFGYNTAIKKNYQNLSTKTFRLSALSYKFHSFVYQIT